MEQIEWLEILKSYQTVAVGFVGFVGVILTMIGNAWFARRRDDRLRRSEADSVAAALYGEIIALRRDIADVSDYVARVEMAGYDHPYMKFDKHFLERSNLPEPLLYRSLAPRLGMLSPDLLLPIIEFYGNLDRMRAWLPRLVPDKERAITYSPTTVLRPARDAVFGVVPALRTIERQLMLTARAGDPKFVRAEAIIETEEANSESNR
ncbi:hypothetical protein [Ensifer sesbaniae]|uniref:hypothetical protein n=1 Tax=Ensifer sesbaniae TaxID=1214071 RepID=UPI0015683C27|nr:hypothetical protein [Ensifer sesbaniae]NRQ19019.1 hypothetical protein [Ensifer sesbaniae]